MSDVKTPVTAFSYPPLGRSQLVSGLAIAAGVFVGVTVPGDMGMGNVHEAYKPVEIVQPRLGTRIVGPITFHYDDSGTGQIVLAGTGTESFQAKPPPLALQGQQQLVAAAPVQPAVPPTLGPRRVAGAPAISFTDSGSGQLLLAGTGTDSFQAKPPPLTIQGQQQAVARASPQPDVPPTLGSRAVAVSSATVFNDSASGQLTLAGSGADSFQAAPPPLQGPGVTAGTLEAVQAFSYPPPGGPHLLSGAGAQIFNDSGAGQISLGGSGVDDFNPGTTVLIVGGQGRSNSNTALTAVKREQVPATQPVSTTYFAYAPNLVVGSPTPSMKIVQGQSNQSQVSVQVPQPGPFEPKQPEPQLFFYVNVAPPVYYAIVPGSTNQGFQMQTARAVALVQNLLGSRIIPPVAQTPGVFNDAGTGQITWAGSGTDSFTGPPPPLTLAGQSQQVRKAVQAVERVQRQLATRIQSPVISQPFTFNDSGTGQITWAGSKTESISYSDSGSGTITLAGSKVEALVYTDSRSGQIVLGGSKTDSYSHSGSGSGQIVIGGSGSDSFFTGVGGSTRLLMMMRVGR